MSLLWLACDSRWVKFKSSCYKFEPDDKQFFGGAVAACNNDNAHLLHIESKSENDFIVTHLRENFDSVPKWRAGAKKVGSRFVWFDSRKKKMHKV